MPFDRWVAGDRDALSPAAQRGWALFSGKAGCIRCHEGPLFADQRFHALGVPRLPQADAHVLLQVTARWQNLQRGVSREQYASGDDDLPPLEGVVEPQEHVPLLDAVAPPVRQLGDATSLVG